MVQGRFLPLVAPQLESCTTHAQSCRVAPTPFQWLSLRLIPSSRHHTFMPSLSYDILLKAANRRGPSPAPHDHFFSSPPKCHGCSSLIDLMAQK